MGGRRLVLWVTGKGWLSARLNGRGQLGRWGWRDDGLKPFFSGFDLAIAASCTLSTADAMNQIGAELISDEIVCLVHRTSDHLVTSR